MILAITAFIFGLWIIAKEHKSLAPKFRLLFFMSLCVMLLTAYLQSISIITFVPKLVLSLLILAVTGAVLSMANGYKIAQWLILGMMTISTYQVQNKIATFIPLELTNENNTETSNLNEILYDVNGEIIVQVIPDSLEQLKKHLIDKRIDVHQAFSPDENDITVLDDYYVLNIPNEQNQIQNILDDLKGMEYILWAEANENIPMEFPQETTANSLTSATLSNDPSVNMQWHLQHLGMEDFYKYFAQNQLKPIKKAKLFILDTGLDFRHEDLVSTSTSKDKQGHGTHCAGVAAAVTNNGIGVASMVPTSDYVSVHGIQVIGDIGFGTQTQIINGIIQAADQGADVISLSLGGITNQEREKAYNDAVKYANDKGAIVVVAAGNANLDAKRYSPANANNVITVSSIDAYNSKSGFSNHVQNISMGLCAPGEKIFSTTPNNTYTPFSGTSMAAPQVAGLIAVIKSFRPDLTTRDVFDLLNTTGKQTQNTPKTGKLIQPLAAIKALLTK